jgi:hypothetical protein
LEKMSNLLTSKPVIYLVNMSATDFICCCCCCCCRPSG